MSNEKTGVGVPDFDSIRQTNPYGIDYRSARDLMPLLGYEKWQKFDGAIKRAMKACEKTGNVVSDHFIGSDKMVMVGSGATRKIKDYTCEIIIID